ncbi:MAG: 16S rRNA (guanine(527)-N(7))-methyltransferase RsmG [Opitutales bacterium]|nr:16S rRNA (guanine(527)-N(7))-methyltransferase RsmG [Opitutales bacterium]
MQRLRAFFKDAPISDEQWSQLEAMAALHREWNAKINLISRKDIDNLEWHHYAHCLVAGTFLRLMSGARVIDVGTGGGFPGLILAVLYPQAQFTLADSIAKKILVVSDIARRLGLKNVTPRVGRVETFKQKFDFVTGRAVSNLPAFFALSKNLISPGKKHSLANGILYWKGGSLDDETRELGVVPDKKINVRERLGDDEYFEGKYILHYPYPAVFAAKTPRLP